MTIEQIEKQASQLSTQLSLSDFTESIIDLMMLIDEYDGETELLWEIETVDNYSLSDLIPAGYWFFSHYHKGQNSKSYQALCILGEIFKPGFCEGPEPGSMEEMIYQDLESME